MRRGLRQVVAEGFQDAVTGEAGDAAAALAAIEREPWDLVVLDVNLPGRSGIDLLGDLQTRFKGLPVLMLSAYPEEDFAVRCIQRGASGYLTKTSASQELVAAVRKVLAGGRYVTASLAERLASVLGGQLEPAPEDALSARELQVLRGVAAGRTLKGDRRRAGALGEDGGDLPGPPLQQARALDQRRAHALRHAARAGGLRADAGRRALR
ncbi:MAG: response regulator transcription factor [Anaeromyxobacter sp.]